MVPASQSGAPLAFAREWFEIQYEYARALHRTAEARLIALRVVELIEQAEFKEVQTLSSPLTVVSDDPCRTEQSR